ncbi:MAG: hypothetical protein AAFV53_28760 [Myxococcota bacterium]
MRSMLLLTAAMMTIGCTRVESTFTEDIPASDVLSLQADLDSGGLSYRGMTTDWVTVTGEAWGSGSNVDKAEMRAAGNDWSVRTENGTLHLDSVSDAALAGVQFDVTGPHRMDVDVAVFSGDIWLNNVEGFAQLTADSITLNAFYGDVDLYTTTGMVDAEVYPTRGGWVRVESAGDVYLTLPWGMDYDLQVWGNPDSLMVIDDLGFRYLSDAPGYFAGVSGAGSIRVDVYATGDVYINSVW